MELEMDVEDLLNKRKLESDRIEFKTGWNPDDIQKRDTFVKLATEYAVKRGTNRINFKVLFEEITICIV